MSGISGNHTFGEALFYHTKFDKTRQKRQKRPPR